MTRVAMEQVYRVVWDSYPVQIARSNRSEFARYSYRQFLKDLVGAELIFTEKVVAIKWMSAIEQAVFRPASDKPKGDVSVDLRLLSARIHEAYSPAKRTNECMNIRSSADSNTRTIDGGRSE